MVSKISNFVHPGIELYKISGIHINKINFYPNFNIVKGLDKTIKKYES